MTSIVFRGGDSPCAPRYSAYCDYDFDPRAHWPAARIVESIPTEVGHAHPLDEAIQQETWGLVGALDGKHKVFPTCTVCHDAGWRPPAFAGMN